MRGVAAVEFALLCIPLMLIALAAVEFGRAMLVYQELAKTVRHGVRYLSFFDPAVSSEYPTGYARNRVVYGVSTPAAGAPALVSGLTVAMVEICDRVTATACPGETFANVATGEGNINLVRVTIRGYRYTPRFPGAGLLGPITFGPISATMRQVL
jgi:Flp pilus assembly protein TadG